MTTLAILLLGLVSYAVWQYRRDEKCGSALSCFGVPAWYFRGSTLSPLRFLAWYLSGQWIRYLSLADLCMEWDRYESMAPRERFEYEYCGDWSGRVHAYSAQARFMAQPQRAVLYGGSRMSPGVSLPGAISVGEARVYARMILRLRGQREDHVT